MLEIVFRTSFSNSAASARLRDVIAILTELLRVCKKKQCRKNLNKLFKKGCRAT